MSFRYLQSLFNPQSIAVIGASSRPRRIGNVVMRNLLAGGFGGAIMPVNPKREAVAGVLTYPDVASLPRTPDLAILCTPAATIPGLIEQLGQRGTRAAIVMAGYLHTTLDAAGRPMAVAVLEAARRHGVRLLGGSTLGLLSPRAGLNATFSQMRVEPGNLGFVSQSDAVGTMVLDWALPKKVGFSHFVSLGDAIDIGFGEVLDFLGSDPDTRAILLYIESIRERRSFMAAARAAARNKPVVAIKAGRAPHNPLLGIADPLRPEMKRTIGDDAVYDAVLSRAGILRVDHLDELFGAVETVVRARPIGGGRLVAISNGGGAGVMVEDTLYLGGYAMPPLSERTTTRLRSLLHRSWDGRNPIDIRVDAAPTRYAEVLKVLNEEREGDAVLVMHTPNALTDSSEIAQSVIAAAGKAGANLLSCWIGDESVAGDRKLFVDAGIPTFGTPGRAARAFLHMDKHRIARDVLMQVPPSVPTEFAPDVDGARAIVGAALAQGRMRLTAQEARSILAAYGIPVAATLGSAPCGETRDLARQLLVGMTADPVFGPLIVFGAGGRARDACHGLAVGLPPLNQPLAHDLIDRGRVGALQYFPAAERETIALTLTKVSQLVVDLPEIVALDINPLCVDAQGVVALDARVEVAPATASPHRLAILPYPQALEEPGALRNGRPVLLRPIRPEDEDAHYVFMSRLTHQDIVYRFFHYVNQMPRRDMARLTQIDYDREMAFIATAKDEAGVAETLGVVRIVADPDHHECEFAIIVRSDMKGQGLGSRLLKKMIAYARMRGIRYFKGDIMFDNQPMLKLLKHLGFRTSPSPDEPGIVRAVLEFDAPAATTPSA